MFWKVYAARSAFAELCRKEGINQNLYHRWSKEFLEAGKKRLAGDTAREATSDEVKNLKAEALQLKETLAEVLIENRLLKKTFSGMGRTLHEVLRVREAGNHPIGRTVVALGPPDAGADRDPNVDVPRLVQPIPGGRDRALEDGKSRSQRIWNKIPDEIATAIVNLALEEPDLSPRELASTSRTPRAAL